MAKPFVAIAGADWTEAIEAIDDETNQPYDLEADATEVELQVYEDEGCCSTTELTRTLAADTIEFTDDHTLRWTFTAAEMSALCEGNTYYFKLLVTTAEGVFALLTGSLVYTC